MNAIAYHEGKILVTAQSQAKALGVSRWTIQAMRKAGRELGDPVGRYTTPRRLCEWLFRHPDFVASHYLGHKPKLGRNGSNPPALGAGRSDGPSRLRDLHTPSPAG